MLVRELVAALMQINPEFPVKIGQLHTTGGLHFACTDIAVVGVARPDEIQWPKTAAEIGSTSQVYPFGIDRPTVVLR